MKIYKYYSLCTHSSYYPISGQSNQRSLVRTDRTDRTDLTS